MIYFFHHYELPAILQQARIQQLLTHPQPNPNARNHPGNNPQGNSNNPNATTTEASNNSATQTEETGNQSDNPATESQAGNQSNNSEEVTRDADNGENNVTGSETQTGSLFDNVISDRDRSQELTDARLSGATGRVSSTLSSVLLGDETDANLDSAYSAGSKPEQSDLSVKEPKWPDSVINRNTACISGTSSQKLKPFETKNRTSQPCVTGLTESDSTCVDTEDTSSAHQPKHSDIYTAGGAFNEKSSSETEDTERTESTSMCGLKVSDHQTVPSDQAQALGTPV